MRYQSALERLKSYLGKRDCLSWHELKAGTVEQDGSKIILGMFESPDFAIDFELNGRCGIVALDDDSLVGFAIERRTSVSAHVKPLGDNTYAVVISTGTIVALWQLSLAVWTSRSFLNRQDFGYGCLEADDIESVIPRGMDAIFEGMVQKVDGFEPAFVAAPWILTATDSLKETPIRRKLMQTSFSEAVRWCWLHECGHVCYRHADWGRPKELLGFVELLSVASRSKSPSMFETTPEVSQLAEIQADRHATGLLTLAIGRRTEMGSYQDAVAAFVGHILVPLCLRGTEIAHNSGEQIRTHPPLWARAELIRTEFNRCFAEVAELSLAAVVEAANFHALTDLSNLHNYFGLLFQNAIGSAGDTTLRDFERSITNVANTVQPLSGIRIRHNFVGVHIKD